MSEEECGEMEKGRGGRDEGEGREAEGEKRGQGTPPLSGAGEGQPPTDGERREHVEAMIASFHLFLSRHASGRISCRVALGARVSKRVWVC